MVGALGNIGGTTRSVDPDALGDMVFSTGRMEVESFDPHTRELVGRFLSEVDARRLHEQVGRAFLRRGHPEAALSELKQIPESIDRLKAITQIYNEKITARRQRDFNDPKIPQLEVRANELEEKRNLLEDEYETKLEQLRSQLFDPENIRVFFEEGGFTQKIHYLLHELNTLNPNQFHPWRLILIFSFLISPLIPLSNNQLFIEAFEEFEFETYMTLILISRMSYSQNGTIESEIERSLVREVQLFSFLHNRNPQDVLIFEYVAELIELHPNNEELSQIPLPMDQLEVYRNAHGATLQKGIEAWLIGNKSTAKDHWIKAKRTQVADWKIFLLLALYHSGEGSVESAQKLVRKGRIARSITNEEVYSYYANELVNSSLPSERRQSQEERFRDVSALNLLGFYLDFQRVLLTDEDPTEALGKLLRKSKKFLQEEIDDRSLPTLLVMHEVISSLFKKEVLALIFRRPSEGLNNDFAQTLFEDIYIPYMGRLTATLEARESLPVEFQDVFKIVDEMSCYSPPGLLPAESYPRAPNPLVEGDYEVACQQYLLRMGHLLFANMILSANRSAYLGLQGDLANPPKKPLIDPSLATVSSFNPSLATLSSFTYHLSSTEDWETWFKLIKKLVDSAVSQNVTWTPSEKHQVLKALQQGIDLLFSPRGDETLYTSVSELLKFPPIVEIFRDDNHFQQLLGWVTGTHLKPTPSCPFSVKSVAYFSQQASPPALEAPLAGIYKISIPRLDLVALHKPTPTLVSKLYRYEVRMKGIEHFPPEFEVPTLSNTFGDYFDSYDSLFGERLDETPSTHNSRISKFSIARPVQTSDAPSEDTITWIYTTQVSSQQSRALHLLLQVSALQSSNRQMSKQQEIGSESPQYKQPVSLDFINKVEAKDGIVAKAISMGSTKIPTSLKNYPDTFKEEFVSKIKHRKLYENVKKTCSTFLTTNKRNPYRYHYLAAWLITQCEKTKRSVEDPSIWVDTPQAAHFITQLISYYSLDTFRDHFLSERELTRAFPLSLGTLKDYHQAEKKVGLFESSHGPEAHIWGHGPRETHYNAGVIVNGNPANTHIFFD